MNEIKTPKTINITAPTISSGWCQVLRNIYNHGVYAQPDNKTQTKRIHLTLKIDNPNINQVHDDLPIKNNMLDSYMKELTEEYADYFDNLDNNDIKKFEYSYAKQLFRYPIYQCKKLFKNDTKTINPFVDLIVNAEENSRRGVGVLWENQKHIYQSKDQPCWVTYKIELINKNQLILYGVYRSWDAYHGLPANLPAIAYAINKIITDYNLPYILKTMYFTGIDAHVYSEFIDEIENLIQNRYICKNCGSFLTQNDRMIIKNDKHQCRYCF